MNIIVLIIGLIIAIIDMYIVPKSLKWNLVKRVICIITGLGAILILDRTYLYFNAWTLIIGLIIGSIFLIIHIIISKGVNLKRSDINSGLVKTCVLIYLFELPAEEFLYRGIIFIALLKLFDPFVAIIASSTIFLILHLKSWSDSFIWIGSFVLGLVCAISMFVTKSIWTAIIIHNLNNFGFLTLVRKKNIYVS